MSEQRTNSPTAPAWSTQVQRPPARPHQDTNGQPSQHEPGAEQTQTPQHRQNQSAPATTPPAPQPQASPPEWNGSPFQQQQQSGLPWQDDRNRSAAAKSRGQRRKATPTQGWQAALYRLTFGGINPGLAPAEQELNSWLEIIDTPVKTHRVTVSSKKGGVGKTTNSLALGTVFAKWRRDQATAIDANPDRGTLAQRLGQEHALTVRDMLEHAADIDGSNALRHFTHQAPSRLEVLASEKDSTKARAFTADDYRLVQQILETFRQIIITDTGLDLTADVFDPIVEHTDSLVIATTAALDSAEIAWETLDAWAQSSPHGAHLARNAVIAVTLTDGSPMSQSDMRAMFTQRARAVVFVPPDKSLAGGAVFDWDSLHKRTKRAEIELAKAVAEDFPQSGFDR